MLLLLSELTNQNERIDAWLSGYIAVDKERGLHMTRSGGRRKAGRPAHYTVWTRTPQLMSVTHVTAHSDEAAIEAANKKLAAEVTA